MRGGLISVEQLNSQLFHVNNNLKLFLVLVCPPADEEKLKTEMLIHPSQKILNLRSLSKILQPKPRGMPTQEQFHEFIEQNEITKDNLIVFFDKPIFLACRAFYTFRYFGYNNVMVLDGGYSKWTDYKNMLPANPPQMEIEHNPHDYNFKILSNKDAQVLVHIIKNGYWNLYVQQLECLDLRTEDEYNEEHLPGFKNVPFPKFLNEDKTFKSEEGIKNVFQEYKVNLTKNIITQCLTGKMATGGAFALYLIKVGCSVYDESLSGYKDSPELTQQEQDKIKHEGFL